MTEGKNKAAILTEISLILAAIFWGTNYAATKFAALSIPPLSIVALRFVVGGLLMYAVLRILEPGSNPGRKDLLRMAGLGCFGVVVAQTSFTFGVSMTTAANTGLIFATAPVWGLLLGLLLGLERPTWGGMVGVALSILGVAIVFWEGLTGAGGGDLGGDLLVLLAALGVGSYTVLSMPLLERHSPLAVATYPIVFGGPLVLVLSIPFFTGLQWESGSVGGSGLFNHLRHRLLLLGVAERDQPHRSQQGARVSVPDHHHRGGLGPHLLRRGSRHREDSRWGHHPYGRVPGPASVTNCTRATNAYGRSEYRASIRWEWGMALCPGSML